MAVVPAELSSKKAHPVTTAFKEAFGAALLALGLSVPILALRAVAVLLAFFGRLLYLAYAAASSHRAPRRTVAKASTGGGIIRGLISLLGLAALLLYPWIALALAGRGGAIKWIDNFGIQILIYIMLGWGLNIVVGLAGLLDLGYVASWRRSGASCWASRCYAFAATIWLLSRLPSARSSAWC
jgi:branched-chain amino acid transport system permease protein